jgi:hypothetical protein
MAGSGVPGNFPKVRVEGITIKELIEEGRRF